MNNRMALIISAFLAIYALVNSCPAAGMAAGGTEGGASLETYIVHMKLPDGFRSSSSMDSSHQVLENWYKSVLSKITASPAPSAAGKDDVSRLVHVYRNVASGFAARLSADEVQELEKMEGFVSARPQKRFRLHTTHSPDFLGLNPYVGVWPGSNFGKGVIIGVLDTGVAPGNPSFNDDGVPPPPAKWKGKCELPAVGCNNKIIGARNFVSEQPGPPVDEEGHGSHTASTAAGNFVKNANVFGMANGTAAGMAPLAHLAIYKVCSPADCTDSDILAAMDAAVEDGVDVLSLSLGGPSQDFFNDGIAIGAFAAIQKGIFVSCSAANAGPINASMSNEAPWILTVGASTIDRKVVATAVLGNQKTYDGESLFQVKDFPTTQMPLIDAGAENVTTGLCAPGSLDDIDVKGKVVLCQRGGGIARIEKGETVKNAGGVAMILMNDEPNAYSTLADAHILPATHVSYAAGTKIKAYINSTPNPTATLLFKGTVIGDQNAPAVASFSSRGPSLASPGILKPDIIGPGVSILAAWPVSVDNSTKGNKSFNMISGTSMSCPHLSGIAAILKSAHPDWSPAAIKSAIMTTAAQTNIGGGSILDERYYPADIFAVGAGHVVPSRANDPGLVYDLQPYDYVPYLCGLGYTDKEIQIIVQQTVNCSITKSIPEAQLNYPSFAVELGDGKRVYTRTVTNVGQANSTYHAAIEEVPGVDVSVTPATVVFTELKEKKTYQIVFSKSGGGMMNATYVQGAVVWSSDKYTVRSPISVKLV